MDLTTLADGALLRKLENLTSFERSSLVLVLHCLREVEQRRLFSEMGFSSLFDYCVKRLHYSDDQAFNRIASARILAEMPELSSSIESGWHSLTVISLVYSFLRREKIEDAEIKRGVLAAMAGLTKRQAERYLASKVSNPAKHRPDKVRILDEQHVELRFVALVGLPEKVRLVADGLAHSHPKIGFGGLFELLCDLALEKTQENSLGPGQVTPQQKPKRRARPGPPIPRPRRSRLHRQVFTRDGHKCSLCASTHALEVDHIIPRAKGGTDSLENLRLLCRSCNQREAIKQYGPEKMNQYL